MKPAFVSPTPQTATVEGVEVRLWAGVTPEGVPFTLLVHRLAVEVHHEAALLERWPILEKRRTVPPEAIKAGGAS